MTPDLIHTLSSMVYLLIEGGFGIALVVAFLDTTIGIGLLIPSHDITPTSIRLRLPDTLDWQGSARRTGCSGLATSCRLTLWSMICQPWAWNQGRL